ncbi:MAG TPA: restriction endonuclease, partial [Pyrinomonadaceae bacterium]|nr:restriction endonuclease [Pyrinomonadaceae bacterium]
MAEPLTSDIHQDAWDSLPGFFMSIASAVEDYEPHNDYILEDDEVYSLYSRMHKESLIKDLRLYCESMMNNLPNKDLLSLKSDFETVVSLCEELGIHLEEEFEEIESCFDILTFTEDQVIFLPKHDRIYTPQLILAVHSELINLIARKPNLIFEISPRQFEEIIAELFIKKGFEVELTKQTRDGGRDIVAVSKAMDVKTKYLIECKRYAMKRKVSVAVVQR